MQIRMIIKFDSDESASADLATRYAARCGELGLMTSEGDVDGRRWLEIDASIEEPGLARLVQELAEACR